MSTPARVGTLAVGLRAFFPELARSGFVERRNLVVDERGIGAQVTDFPEIASTMVERVSRLILYGTYARGRLRRENSPDEIEKGRLLLDLTRRGWGQGNHPFL